MKNSPGLGVSAHAEEKATMASTEAGKELKPAAPIMVAAPFIGTGTQSHSGLPRSPRRDRRADDADGEHPRRAKPQR